MSHTALKTLKSCLGIAVCTSAAAVLAVFQRETPDFRAGCLGLCLLAVAVTSWLCGRWPAVIGSVAVSLTLAIWLFPPVGSLIIPNPADVQALVLFQIGAIATALVASEKPQGALPGL
jgi:K+-sensing histidine kinase KdpD